MRRRRQVNIWPGFVDALASLLLVFLFVLLIFALSQFFLTDTVSDQDRALAQLKSRIEALDRQLRAERREREQVAAALMAARTAQQARRSERDAARARVEEEAAARAEAEAEAARQHRRAEALQEQSDALAARLREGEAALADARGRIAELEGEVAEQRLFARAERAEVRQLTRRLEALNRRLERVSAALAKAEDQAAAQRLQLQEMGRQLNLALARRVEELERYRSEFFGRLREVLGDNPDIRVAGDRFVFRSRVFFDSGSATLGEEGREQLRRLAETLEEVSDGIPKDVDWILRVDGHADRRPIRTGPFASNRELSSARALAIVRFLEGEGLPGRRLVAAGFGSHHPVAEGEGPEAWARNRRIEFKLTRP
ncbi:MAG: peptidoglycan -binding protein [Thiohalospira sp.]